MLLDPLNRRLRRLFGARPEPLDRPANAARRDALEQRLIAQHRSRYGARDQPPPVATRWPGLTLAVRLGIASVALTAAGVAACELPVDVELELGRRLVFEVPADDQVEPRIEAVVQALERTTGADEIELRVRHSGGPSMTVTLDVWGEALDLDAMQAVLAEHGFAANEVHELALAGSVRTTWGDRLGNRLFDLDLDIEAMDVTEARQRILDQLEAQGFDGEADVEVSDDEDGRRRVEIRLRQHDDGGHKSTHAP